MANLLRTVLYQRHVELGAQIVEFGGWQMPVQYPAGILAEHLATRSQAGLFDVSHMGRFIIRGRDAPAFLQHALTNNAAALEPGQSQYTLLADPMGGAVDDAYLYRFFEDSFLLVVNAANRQKDWRHLEALRSKFKDVTMEDHTLKMAMISLQGPLSKAIISDLLGPQALGDPQRNALGTSVYDGHPVWLGRTGYTGEPLCFELFIPVETATAIWDALLDKGAQPIGLGARDTLRLEAGLPLYGHELGEDPQGRPIPIFAISLARFAVSFSPLKGDFAGKQALLKQYECLQTIIDQRQGDISALPRRVRTVELIDKGIARAGALIYYQGTDFIQAVEEALVEQMCLFLGCSQVETRPISGQMANMVLFSAMVDFINRTDRKVEQRRIRQVMNHHIIKGGHLSAQPMGALRDYVMRDSQTERPAVVNFPVLAHNPYQVDVDACAALMERYRPELIILGKSMILHKEPVAAMRRLIDGLGLDSILMYDMAHVLGLAGPHFQQPFAEGADLVTGSTHKTFFGTQRGIVAADFATDQDRHQALWEAIDRRAFPGSVSNHHLGTLLGLLAAAMEMNAFKKQYQPAVIANAKAFAKALHDCGLAVAGDAAIDFTETHQVIVEVGYTQGPRIARLLEENNIICNYQATPHEEGFTASGALRLGVAEMTRFGMLAEDFKTLAQLMADVIVHSKNVKQNVRALREEHMDLNFCYTQNDIGGLMEELHRTVSM